LAGKWGSPLRTGRIRGVEARLFVTDFDFAEQYAISKDQFAFSKGQFAFSKEQHAFSKDQHAFSKDRFAFPKE